MCANYKKPNDLIIKQTELSSEIKKNLQFARKSKISYHFHLVANMLSRAEGSTRVQE